MPREKIILACETCKNRNYFTNKNKRLHPERVEWKIYPGYVLVEMVMDQETAHTVNGIQGVIKFVGHERLPQPLRPEEVNRLLGVADDSEPEEVKEEIPFLVGQAVSFTDAPFT